ncbi:MAG: OadG family protein [Christensenellaceae bacterium]|jgi:hypothetical protein|nr:OadG family protein [Christensenellaceae bacterium]
MYSLLGKIDLDALKNAGDLAWKGMLSIFIVMALIYVLIIVLNKVTNKTAGKTISLKSILTKFTKRKTPKEPIEDTEQVASSTNNNSEN